MQTLIDNNCIHHFFQIIESDKSLTLATNDTGFSCDGTANTFRVMFKEPVEILPNVSYTACATLKVRSPHNDRRHETDYSSACLQTNRLFCFIFLSLNFASAANSSMFIIDLNQLLLLQLVLVCILLDHQPCVWPQLRLCNEHFNRQLILKGLFTQNKTINKYFYIVSISPLLQFNGNVLCQAFKVDHFST